MNRISRFSVFWWTPSVLPSLIDWSISSQSARSAPAGRPRNRHEVFHVAGGSSPRLLGRLLPGRDDLLLVGQRDQIRAEICSGTAIWNKRRVEPEVLFQRHRECRGDGGDHRSGSVTSFARRRRAIRPRRAPGALA